MIKVVVFFLGSLLSLSQTFAANPVVITVSAASSLTNAFKEMGLAFEAQNNNIKIQWNFAASGHLLQQIVKGAPVDVFASADQETMDRAEQLGFIEKKQRKHFASNTLVLIVPKGSKQVPARLNDLTTSKYQRIAMGLPASVPVGRYTQLVLERSGLWQVLESKMIGSQNVRQALDYVARGEVDAGFVYATDVAVSDKVRIAITVPTDKKILYPIAPVLAEVHGDYHEQSMAAQKFITFVNSQAGQAILAKHGFGKP